MTGLFDPGIFDIGIFDTPPATEGSAAASLDSVTGAGVLRENTPLLELLRKPLVLNSPKSSTGLGYIFRGRTR